MCCAEGQDYEPEAIPGRAPSRERRPKNFTACTQLRAPLRLTGEELAHLDDLTAEEQQFEPRRKLITEGKPGNRMYILKAGWLVESKQLRNGRRQVLSFPVPGDIVGVECLAYRTALHSTAALTRCTVAPFSAERFEQTQQQFPRLATALFLMTLRESAILHEWEVNLGRRAAFPRVAHLLIELSYRLRRRWPRRRWCSPISRHTGRDRGHHWVDGTLCESTFAGHACEVLD